MNHISTMLIRPSPEITDFSTKYFIQSKVYIDEGGIKSFIMVCPPVREIIHSLELVNYLLVQADKPWYMYNYYISGPSCSKHR